jgi:hypothetical protein
MLSNPSDLTDRELDAAISQLESEVSMPGPSPTEELEAHRDEARNRGLFL